MAREDAGDHNEGGDFGGLGGLEVHEAEVDPTGGAVNGNTEGGENEEEEDEAGQVDPQRLVHEYFVINEGDPGVEAPSKDEPENLFLPKVAGVVELCGKDKEDPAGGEEEHARRVDPIEAMLGFLAEEALVALIEYGGFHVFGERLDRPGRTKIFMKLAIFKKFAKSFCESRLIFNNLWFYGLAPVLLGRGRSDD